MLSGSHDRLVGKRVLVTGGAGFIGSHLCRALITRGAEVVVADDLQSGRAERVPAGARLEVVDVGSDAFDHLLDQHRPQLVFHLAHAHFTARNVEEPLRDVPAMNGMLRILGRSRRLAIEKIVFASSGFVYGNSPALPLREQERPAPISPYAASKLAIEHYLAAQHRLFGIPFAVLRYPVVYGPGQMSGALPDYVRTLLAGRQADIYGDGSKTRDYVFVADVVEANLRAAELPDDVPDPVFNVSTGIETPLLALYRAIARQLGREAEPRYLPDRPGEQIRYCLDPGKARRMLGWCARVDLETGLARTIEAIRAGAPEAERAAEARP